VLHILAPPWAEQPDRHWLSAVLPGTAAVYLKEDGRLWLALHLLRERGGFAMPDDARRLIEGVYGDDAESAVPPDLWETVLAASGDAKADGTVARLNALEIGQGYTAESAWWDEAMTPTRLGEPTTTVFLARASHDGLGPLRDGDAYPWMASSLRARQAQIAAGVTPSSVSEEELAACRERLPGKGRWGVLVVLEQEGNGEWGGAVRDRRERSLPVRYSAEVGLEVG